MLLQMINFYQITVEIPLLLLNHRELNGESNFNPT